MMKTNTLAATASRPACFDLYPLSQLYALRGGAAPVVQTSSASFDFTTNFYARQNQDALVWAPVEPDEVPEPCRSLLVHWSDMTSTLEGFYKEKLRVEVLARHATGNEYFREVTLRQEPSGKAVEFGATKVMLDIIPDEVRREILLERLPLGRILVDSGIEFSSQPRAFLRVAADTFILRALDLAGPQILHGRCNTLLDAWERPLADIVEILAPA